MDARRLFEKGEVRAAQASLSEWLRGHPNDTSQRTFLFELLCFSGDWERAQRQLTRLAHGNPQREMGSILYLSALHAERTRHERAACSTPAEGAAPVSGTLNGRPFHNISDIDPAIGQRLEIFVAGSYALLPFAHIESIEIAPPRRLRDTLWAPATIRTNASLNGGELKEVLLPAIYPFSWKTADEAVWLGRETRWMDEGGCEHPAGQKMFRVDEEEIPLLDIRELRFACAAEFADA